MEKQQKSGKHPVNDWYNQLHFMPLSLKSIARFHFIILPLSLVLLISLAVVIDD